MEVKTGSFFGAVALALLWAFVWATPGGVIEAIDNVAPAARSFTREVDMWPQTLGLPGLVAGVLFAGLLSISEGRRRLADVAPSRTGAWGAVAGLVVGALVVWVVDSGLSQPGALAAAVLGFATLMGAVSGLVSPVAFRYIGERRASARSVH